MFKTKGRAMRKTIVLSMVVVALSFPAFARFLAPTKDRGLTRNKMIALYGGDVPVPSCCGFNSKCAPTYYQNACNDPVRNSSSLCVAQSIVQGNPYSCQASADA